MTDIAILASLATDLTGGRTSGLRYLDDQGTLAIVLDVTGLAEDDRKPLEEKLRTGLLARSGVTSVRVAMTAERKAMTIIAVGSGKGGVGKSTLTANLAIALARRGRKVGLVDADIYGPSQPVILGNQGSKPVARDKKLEPVDSPVGIPVLSMGHLVEPGRALAWRGPMAGNALTQLIDAHWGDVDTLLVDLPPGTGDIAISLAGFLPTAEMYVVTTPQPAAQTVAQRAAFMAEKVNLKVHGVIENMSWFTGDDGTRYELFGSGGGDSLAKRLDVPLIGQVPLVPELREGADHGRPVAEDPTSEAGVVFAEMARMLDVEMKPTKRRHRELKII